MLSFLYNTETHLHRQDAVYFENVYLEILNDLAHGASHVPRLGDVTENRGRQADEKDEKVGDRQVDDEQVGDGSHLTISPDDEADEKISHQSGGEDDQVHEDQDPLEFRRKDVPVDQVDVIVVTDAVVIQAYRLVVGSV